MILAFNPAEKKTNENHDLSTSQKIYKLSVSQVINEKIVHNFRGERFRTQFNAYSLKNASLN